jgi:hypothetical protein
MNWTDNFLKKKYGWPKNTRSVSLAIKETQIKMTLGFHLPPVRMAVIKKNNQPQMPAVTRGGGGGGTLLVGM